MGIFFHNASLTAQSATFPIFVISYIGLSTSYYLYRVCDLASLSTHYAFIYHILASMLVVVPFVLSIRERSRFEDLRYIYRCNSEAVRIYIGYCLLSSMSWAYIWAYLLGDGAFAAASNISLGWVALIGVNLVPLWFLARP